MNLTKHCSAKPYSLLVTDSPLALDNLLRFRENLYRKIVKNNHN